MSKAHLITLICILGSPLVLIAQKQQQTAPFRFQEIKLQSPDQAAMKTANQTAEWYIVKFDKEVDKSLLPLEHAYYLGQNTYLLKSKMAQLQWWMQEDKLKGWAIYEENLKVHPKLINGAHPPYLEVVLNKGISHNDIMHVFDRKDIPIEKAHPSSNFAVIKNEADVIKQLKEMDEVVFIHPGGRKSVPEDLRSKALHRSDLLEDAGEQDLGFDGEGVNVLVRDDGFVGPHLDFKGRLFNAPNLRFRPGRDHADGVAGIIGAAGNVEKQGRGMAPAAHIYVTNYEASFLDNTLDLHLNEDVLYTNSSYSNGCNHGYTPNAAEVDRQIHAHPTLLHIFSAGNDGNSDCEYGAGARWGNITGGHKQAKNCIATANVNANGQIISSSSRGPASDGRLKPEIAANGHLNYSTDHNNTYQEFGGTSGAAPCVAGVAAQLCEAYRSQYNTTPPSALIKAALMNSADEAGEPGPDFIYGWGLLDAYGAYLTLKEERFFSAELAEGEQIDHQIQVPGDVTKLKVMLYWADPPAAPMAEKALVNNLDLKVNFDGNEYLPLILDHRPDRFTLDDPAVPGIDTINNAEQIVIDDILEGVANINIRATTVPSGLQRYYIVYEFLKDSTPGFEWTNPEPGQVLNLSTNIGMSWENNISNSSQKTISYSLDGGQSWTDKNIFSASDSYLLRLDSITNGDSVMLAVTEAGYSDTLSEPVYIAEIHRPEEIFIDSVCAQQAHIRWTKKTNADNYEVYSLGENYPERILETADTFAVVPIGNPSEAQMFAIATHYGSVSSGRSDGKLHSGGLLNCPQNIEMAADSIQLLNALQLYYCNPFELRVATTVSNFGLQDIDSFELCYRLENGAMACQWFDRDLVSMSQDVVELDSTLTVTEDARQIQFWVNAPGDDYFYNDTITEEINLVFRKDEMVIDSLIMDFSGNGLPALTRIVNFDNSLSWRRSIQTNKANQRSPMLVMPNYFYQDTGEIDAFFTPIINLDSFQSPQLVFDYAYAAFDGFPDELIVIAAPPCDIYNADTLWKGKGLDMATTVSGADDLEPDSYDEWGEVMVSLEPYIGREIIIGFVSVNQWGNNIFIDDIAIMPDSSYRHSISIDAQPPDTACVDSTVQAVVEVEGSGEFKSRWYNQELGTNTTGDTLEFDAEDFFRRHVAFVSNAYYTTFAPFNIELYENPRLSPREIDRMGDTIVMRSRATVWDSIVWYGDNGAVLRGDTVSYIRQNGEGMVQFEVVAFGRCASALRVITLDFTTALEEGIGAQINLYPNPIRSGQFYINGLEGVSIAEVAIYNNQSQLIYWKQVDGHGDQLNLQWPAEVPSGMYIVNLKDEEGRVLSRKKVIRLSD